MEFLILSNMTHDFPYGLSEQSDGSQVFEEGRDTWANSSARDPRTISTPPDGTFPMHNDGAVQFESPKVPVIFVLGKFWDDSQIEFTHLSDG